MEQKKNNKVELTDLNDLAKSLTQVTKFTATTLILVGGAFVLLKLSKLMLKEIKELGL
jgi:hypothetical protein